MGHDYLVLHSFASRRRANSISAAHVARFVEQFVTEGKVVRFGRDARIVVDPRQRRDDRGARIGKAIEDDVDDLLAIDPVGERLAHDGIQQFTALGLIRIRIEGEVVER